MSCLPLAVPHRQHTPSVTSHGARKGPRVTGQLAWGRPDGIYVSGRPVGGEGTERCRPCRLSSAPALRDSVPEPAGRPSVTLQPATPPLSPPSFTGQVPGPKPRSRHLWCSILILFKLW